MRHRTWAIVSGLAFIAGGLAGTILAKKEDVPPSVYSGKPPAEAASALLGIARAYAEEGSHENIHVARVYLLGGMEAEGEAILQRVLSGAEVKAGDWIRAGRVYAQAGRWDEARRAFDRVVEMEPRDEDWLAEVGAFYNLNGDRSKAEELFARSFAEKPLLKNILAAAGSYVGVDPRQR